MLDQAVGLLRSRGRVSFHALKIQFSLDDEQLAALKAELLYAHPGAIREDGPGLIWVSRNEFGAHAGNTAEQQASLCGEDAERRHLTVLFCDMVDSTPSSLPHPAFAQYQQKTDRQLPVIRLVPRAS